MVESSNESGAMSTPATSGSTTGTAPAQINGDKEESPLMGGVNDANFPALPGQAAK